MVFILFFIIALLLATTILFLKRINQNLQKDLNRLNDSLQASNASIQKLQIQESKSAALADERQQVILSNTAVIDSLNKEKTQLTADKATLAKLLETKETSLQQINTQHLNDLEETKKAFATEFELLSNKLLKASSKEFAENSKAKIDELISPLKTRIETFQSNILNMQKDTISERLTLKANIKSIAESNSLLANQTDRLTKALRGDVQRQGAWGELILETVLESSGLRKGFEYNVHGIGIELQNSEGKRQYPDVIINLPDNKHIIIDSKFSYIPYDNYLEAETAEEKASCLESLVQSVQTHIKGLSEKKYSFADKLNTPDLTLMFIPIEAMFSLVIQAKRTIFEDAWKKSIVIVSPANLLAILRTIESIWKVELQNRNAQEIAKEGGLLYDKFVGLLENLKSLKSSLDGAVKNYDGAMVKLEGRGNIISKIQNLKKLGLKTKGSIPKQFLDEELVELDHTIENEREAIEFDDTDIEKNPLPF